MTELRPPRQPLAYSVQGAAEATGLSTRTIQNLIKDDALIARYSGAKRLILATELLAWHESLPYERQ